MNFTELAPLIAAVIGLAPAFLKWLSDRSRLESDRRQTQAAKEGVEFWQTWFHAQKVVSSDEKLDELKVLVRDRLDELRLVQDRTIEAA